MGALIVRSDCSLASMAAALLLICSAAGCGRSSFTNVVGPTASKCAVSVTNNTPQVPAAGGAGAITVTAQRECSWSARADATWITLSGTTGQGTATVSYTVSANPNGTPRRGQVVVSEQNIEIVQVAAPCRYAVAPSTVDLGASGGEVTVTLTAPGGCVWRARGDVSWISSAVPGEGAGSATLRLTVAQNTGEPRSGTVTIADVSVRVRQSGLGAPAPPPAPACNYALSPVRITAPTSGQQAVVSVTAQDGCAWVASSSVPWITVEGATGTGAGSFSVAIGANSGESRTGTVGVADQTLTVDQAGGRCMYDIAPTSYNAGRGPDDVRISVTAPSGCAWTATSPADWVTVADGGSGSGDGTVRLRVDANNGPERTADLTIAGETFHLRQFGCSTSIRPTWYHAGRGPDDISIAVTADNGCRWTAASTVSWVTVAEGATGSGNGTVRLLVEPNGGGDRSVTLIIAAHPFELRQSGSN
jgi:hypothetical protein